MSFVMIATGATTRSGMRMLPLRGLLLAALASALALLVVGAGLGYWLAVPSTPLVAVAIGGAAAMPTVAAPTAAPRPHAALPFALEQLGALSGRLFRLESQAAQLSKRVGVPHLDAAATTERKGADSGRGAALGNSAAQAGSGGNAGSSTNVGSGGPMLPPRADDASLEALDAQRLEQQIALVSDAAAERHLDTMRMPTRLPISGAELVSVFGNRDDPIAHRHAFHAGLDFAAERGTPIRAAAGGRVAFAGFRADFGWLVEIDHGNGLATRYAHASRLLVDSGDIVMPGERIAMVGSTGRSTGPHLHFEVLRRGAHVDPRQYLAKL